MLIRFQKFGFINLVSREQQAIKQKVLNLSPIFVY